MSGPPWLSSKQWAMPGVVIAAVWKDTGYYALMVLAALKSIDPAYYEAASIDGASPARSGLRASRCRSLSPTLFPAGCHQCDLRPAGVRIGADHDGRRAGRRLRQVFLERILQVCLPTSTRWALPRPIRGSCSWFILLFTLVQFRLQKKWVNYDA